MKRGLFAAFLLCLGVATAPAQKLIGEGESWRYYKGTSFPGATWTQIGFNDGVSPWLSGNSGFGYSDGDDATVLGDMQGTGPTNYVSVYTRKAFNVVNPGAITRLTLAADYDDGFVAYLNGTEVARRTMNAGTPDYTTTANGNHEPSRGDAGGSPNEKEWIAISPALLVAGTNVLAVEGHNISQTSSDFSLIIELYAGVNLTRGPFLQMPSPGGMTVAWRTDALTDSQVDYGFDTNYSSGTVSDPTLTIEHAVNLPNLQPDQTYFYRVRSGGVVLSEGNSFKSARSAAQPYRFSVVGDFGYANADTTNVANRIAASNCDLLMTVGDNIYEPVGGTGTGQPGIFDPYWFTPYAATLRHAPIFPALGNHDIETTNGFWYLKYFNLPQNGPATELERNYSFDYGNAHFAVIDANAFVNPYDATRATNIKNWLAADLAATNQRWKFVFFHQPAYSSSGSGVHSPESQLQTDIQPICAQYGVQVVFQGHNHFYERINPINGVNYFITGTGGRSLTTPSVFPAYSATVNSSVYGFTQVDINGGSLILRQIDANGTQIDSFTLDLDLPFNMDGLLDSAAYLRATNGLKLYAAIRKNFLYLATQDAGEGSDHFIYLANQTAPLHAMNWAKAGQVMTWSAFLADENDSGFKAWFNASEQIINDPANYAVTTSGLNNNGASANGVLEGRINLVNHFGAFPAQLYVAAAPFGNGNAGALVSSAQVPAGNGDGTIQTNEFLLLNPRDIALDLPVSGAGADQTVEAGMKALVSGAGSTAPSGLTLGYAWSELSGPAGTLNNPNQAVADFVLGANVAITTDVVLQLRVNDTRFDADDTMTIHFYPMVDTDGDGLSDQEELTGVNNALTTADPNGKQTNPNVADSDGDGMSDGQEALAATDPNNPAARFQVVSVTKDEQGVHITWSSVVGRTYQAQSRADFSANWVDLGGPQTATLATTSALEPTPAEATKIYRVILVP